MRGFFFSEKTLPSKPSHLKIRELIFSLILPVNDTIYSLHIHELPH